MVRKSLITAASETAGTGVRFLSFSILAILFFSLASGAQRVYQLGVMFMIHHLQSSGHFRKGGWSSPG
jgi:hypothetical protein